MSDAVPISRDGWLNAYEEFSQNTPQDQAAKQVFDSLESCEFLTADFERTETAIRARFLITHTGLELIRVVIRPQFQKVFVSYHAPKLWPELWEQEFEHLFGIVPRMGGDIVDWCAEHNENTGRLISWLIDKAREQSSVSSS